MEKKLVGILCYNLTSASTSIIKSISPRNEYAIKIFPIFGPTPENYNNFRVRQSTLRPKTISLNNLSGTAPEIQLITIGASVVSDLIREADILCLIGLQGIPAFLATIIGYLMRKPIITIIQTMTPEAEKRRSLIIRGLKKIMLKKTTYFIAQTPPTIRTLEDNYHIFRDKIFYIPWDGGADEFKIILDKNKNIPRNTTRSTLGLSISSKVILFCGTLYYLKGIDVLIKAFAKFLHEQPDSVLMLVGPDGGKKGKLDDLQKLADSLKIRSKIRFVGYQSWAKLVHMYMASDLFVLPTRKDVWPKVLVEASLAGLPLITTQICGAAGYVVQDKKNGFIIPVNDVDALFIAMKKLMNGHTGLAFGEESKRIVQEFLPSEDDARLYSDIIVRCLDLA
jgi:glycosyltransferase involved in cell wall biosynthesis